MDDSGLPLVVDMWEDAPSPAGEAAATPRSNMPRSVDEQIAEMSAIIAREFDPRQILLFGSRARGDHRPSSDVDLLVVFDHVARKRTLAAAIDDRLAPLPQSRDIIVATAEEISEERSLPGSLLGTAMRDGKLLYERGRPHPECARLAPLRAS